MTDYQHCNKCDKDFSLEQPELASFCPFCGTDLRLHLTDEQEKEFLDSLQKYPQARVDDLT